MQTRPPVSREPWVDALRVLAVLGVFIVNAMGYPFAPDYPVQAGAPQPADSTTAIVINGLLIAFVQSKAWPLLTFLFGYSLCSIALQSRAKGWVARDVLRLRYWKLLLVGVLHGALIYFGDVLTVYALCGLVAARWALLRPAQLLKVWKTVTIFFIISTVIYALLAVALLFFQYSPADASALAIQTKTTLFAAPDIVTLLALNMRTYFGNWLEVIIFLPFVFWLTVAGILARRFQLLSNRRFAQWFWAKHLLIWQLFFALAFNVSLGLAAVQFHTLGSLHENKLYGVSALSTNAGIWLAACLLAWGMRRWHKRSALSPWVIWLAPAGRHTLAMYLWLSIVLMLSSHAYLGVSGSTPLRLGAVMLAWISVVCLARQASKLGMRDPIARWLSSASVHKNQKTL